jgi:integrase
LPEIQQGSEDAMKITFKPMWPPEKQVKRLFAASGMYSSGPTDRDGKRSRKLAIGQARAAGARSSHDQSYQTPIYAKTTGKKYEAVAASLLRFCVDTDRANTIDSVTPEHIKDFLMTKLGCRKATFDAYTSALGKLDSALSKACGRPPQWKELLKEMRLAAAVVLKGEQPARAYSRPQEIIDKLTGKYLLVGELQYRAGFRISEATGTGGFKPLSAENLKGVTIDPYLKKPAGLITVTGKGGKRRVVPIPIELYRRLENHILLNGELTVHQGLYRSLLKDAAVQTGQKYAGRSSHGLRWCYVQDVSDVLCAMGYPAEEAMLEAQKRLGHNDLHHTWRYNRRG